MIMNRFRLMLIALSCALCGLMTVSCSDDGDGWDDMPPAISRFVSQYFPTQGIESVNELPDGGYRVKVNDSATLVFDSTPSWTSIDGNGSPLPALLIYDQLPQKLYDYLADTEQTSGVYSLSRDYKTYTVGLHDTTLIFNIQTGAITYPRPEE